MRRLKPGEIYHHDWKFRWAVRITHMLWALCLIGILGVTIYAIVRG